MLDEFSDCCAGFVSNLNKEEHLMPTDILETKPKYFSTPEYHVGGKVHTELLFSLARYFVVLE